MLQVKNLNVYYGNIHALKDVSLYINQGEIVALIGANGAGKTSLLRSITNLITNKTGDVLFNGKSIFNMQTYKLTGLGISHVPEGRKIFTELSVYENLLLGAYLKKDKNQVYKSIDKMFEVFPRLRERKGQQSGTLSGGEQQMLAIARGLMSDPKILLLDEPSLGLAPILVNEIFNIVKRLNDEGITIIIVEQNAFETLNISHRAYCLEVGKVVIEGDSKELLNDKRITEAYLGG